MLVDLIVVEDRLLLKEILFVAPPVALGLVLVAVALEEAEVGAVALVVSRDGVLELIGELT